MIDLVFALDIIFTFFSAYYNSMDELICGKRQIACNYIKSWLIIDIITMLPLSLVFQSQAKEFLKLAKLPRIFQVLKATKMVRTLHFIKSRSRIRRKLETHSSNHLETERLLLFSLLFCILCHNLSCLWFLVAKLQNFNPSTWVSRYQYWDSPISQQYLAGLYFIVTTISTVGYGDITSQNPAQQIFCVVLMIIGVIAYSMAISSITNIMSASSKAQKLLLQKLKVLSHLRQEYNLSFQFYWKLRQSLHHEHTMDRTEKQNFLRELPSKLQVQLSNIMYAHELAGVRFFQDKQPKFIAAVAPKLKPLKVCKGDYIFCKGDSLDGIYFIKRGQAVYVERRKGADLIFATNKLGTHFGDVEFAILCEGAETRREFTVKAKSDMELLFLEKGDLFALDNQFKDIVLGLFKRSIQHYHTLQNMNKRSKEWLHRRHKTDFLFKKNSSQILHPNIKSLFPKQSTFSAMQSCSSQISGQFQRGRSGIGPHEK